MRTGRHDIGTAAGIGDVEIRTETVHTVHAASCSKEPHRGTAQLWRTLDAHGFGGRFLVFPHHLSATHTHAHIRIHRYALTRWALLRRRGGVGAAAVVAAGIASWV